MLGTLDDNYLTVTLSFVGVFMSSLKIPDSGICSSLSFTVSTVDDRNLVVSFQPPSAEIPLPPQQGLLDR